MSRWKSRCIGLCSRLYQNRYFDDWSSLDANLIVLSSHSQVHNGGDADCGDLLRVLQRGRSDKVFLGPAPIMLEGRIIISSPVDADVSV